MESTLLLQPRTLTNQPTAATTPHFLLVSVSLSVSSLLISSLLFFFLKGKINKKKKKKGAPTGRRAISLTPVKSFKVIAHWSLGLEMANLYQTSIANSVTMFVVLSNYGNLEGHQHQTEVLRRRRLLNKAV